MDKMIVSKTLQDPQVMLKAFQGRAVSAVELLCTEILECLLLQDELADLDGGEDGPDAVALDYDDGVVAGDAVVEDDVGTGKMAG